MGFVIKYSRFFNVSLIDSDTGGPVTGIRFFPTRQCSAYLENYKLVFRRRSSGFDLYYSETPLVEISSRIRFSFGFTISDRSMFARYGLVREDELDTTLYEPGLYFDNLKDDGSIITDNPASLVSSGVTLDKTVSAGDTFKIYPMTFNAVVDTGGTIPDEYELKHKYDPDLNRAIPVLSESGMDYIITTVNSPLPEEEFISESGPFILEANTATPAARNIYLSNEVVDHPDIHGIVDLYWETSQDTVSDPEKGQEYKITFKPKQD